ncbi:MAG: glycosyltransferase [Acidobacteriota bacterium]|nr:glycosyltransferase [Acidobacteriota bacterium]MDH3784779.1 glycosyltransferase [Acidobacteriota bacterium]
MNWTQLAIDLIYGFNLFVLIYFIALNSTYLLLFILSLRAVFVFVRRTFFSDYQQIMQSEMTWPISIVVAAHDEEKTIVETVRSLMMVNYSEFEIIVVNDGSDDRTLDRLLRAFDLSKLDKVYQKSIPTEEIRGVYGSLVHDRLIVVDKVRGGKSDALNAGINICRYPLFCSVDADSVIEDNALLRVVKPFMEHPQETVAVGGIVRIVNGCTVKDGRVTRIALPGQPLPIFQVVEYLRAFLSGRVGWSVLRSLLIISGAFGVYRKHEVVEIGGYSRDTETEDLDLVVRLHRFLKRKKRKYRVVFVPDPVCWTEVPSSLSVLRRQRNRWHRGLIQVLWENRGVTFNPRYGGLGMLAFPHMVFFEMLGPFIEILGYIVVILAYALGLLNIEYFLLFLAAAILYGIFLSVAAVLLEEMSFRRYPSWMDLTKLIAFGILENFGYRQMLSLFKVRAFWDVLWRRRGWGRMDRVGFGRDPKEPTASERTSG